MDTRNGTITIFYGENQFLDIRKGKLYRFPYFRVSFEANQSLSEIKIPENEFIELIEETLENSLPSEEETDIQKNFKFIGASSFLGAKSDRFIENIKNTLKNSETSLKDIIPYINEFSRYNLLRTVVNIYEYSAFDLSMPGYSHCLITVYPDDRLNDDETKAFSKIIPHITSFANAFIICDAYDLDFNLITSKPTLRDMFVYQTTKNNLKTENVCEIFARNMRIVRQFFRYFDSISVNYTFDLNEERTFPRQYIDPKYNVFFHINFEVNSSLPWHPRDKINLQDRGNSLSAIPVNIDPEDLVTFCTTGRFPVEDLLVPVTDEFYDSNNFYLEGEDFCSDLNMFVKLGFSSYEEIPPVKPFPQRIEEPINIHH